MKALSKYVNSCDLSKTNNLFNKKIITFILCLSIQYAEKVHAACQIEEPQRDLQISTIANKNKEIFHINKVEFEDFDVIWELNTYNTLRNYDNGLAIHTGYGQYGYNLQAIPDHAKIMDIFACPKYLNIVTPTYPAISGLENLLRNETELVKKVKYMYSLSILFSEDPYTFKDVDGDGKMDMTPEKKSYDDVSKFYFYANKLRSIITSTPDYLPKYQIILDMLTMFEMQLIGGMYNASINGAPMSAFDTDRELTPPLKEASREGLDIIKRWIAEGKEAAASGDRHVMNGYVMRMLPFLEGFTAQYYRRNLDVRWASTVDWFHLSAEELLHIMKDLFVFYETRLNESEERNYFQLLIDFLHILPDHMSATMNNHGTSTILEWAIDFAPTADQYIQDHFEDMNKDGKYHIHDQTDDRIVAYVHNMKMPLILAKTKEMGAFLFANKSNNLLAQYRTTRNIKDLQDAISISNSTGLVGRKRDFDREVTGIISEVLGIEFAVTSASTPMKAYNAEHRRDMYHVNRVYKIYSTQPWKGTMVLRFDYEGDVVGSSQPVGNREIAMQPGQHFPTITLNSKEVYNTYDEAVRGRGRYEHLFTNVRVTDR